MTQVNAKARVNKTFIVLSSHMIINYGCQNIFIVEVQLKPIPSQFKNLIQTS
jgi:hypothetical protein